MACSTSSHELRNQIWTRGGINFYLVLSAFPPSSTQTPLPNVFVTVTNTAASWGPGVHKHKPWGALPIQIIANGHKGKIAPRGGGQVTRGLTSPWRPWRPAFFFFKKKRLLSCPWVAAWLSVNPVECVLHVVRWSVQGVWTDHTLPTTPPACSWGCGEVRVPGTFLSHFRCWGAPSTDWTQRNPVEPPPFTNQHRLSLKGPRVKCFNKGHADFLELGFDRLHAGQFPFLVNLK